jgi:hypothetical protein
MRTFFTLLFFLAVKFGFPILIVLLVVFAKKWWRSAREGRAESWPSASGHVERATVQPMRSARRSVIQFYECTLTYNYRASEYQAGVFKKTFRSEQAADDFANACKGKDIQVRYDPRNERKSVLIEQDLRMVVPVALAGAYGPSSDYDRSRWSKVRTILRPFI